MFPVVHLPFTVAFHPTAALTVHEASCWTRLRNLTGTKITLQEKKLFWMQIKSLICSEN